MENEREQLRLLLKSESLIFGDFTLASGKKSTFYFDSKRTTLLPDARVKSPKIRDSLFSNSRSCSRSFSIDHPFRLTERWSPFYASTVCV